MVQDELPGAPFASARTGVDGRRVPAFSCFGRHDCGRAAPRELRVYVRRYVRVRRFVHEEREAAWRRGDERGQLVGGRGVSEDRELARRGERGGLVDDEADARIYDGASLAEETRRFPGSEERARTRTPVDEWSGAHVHGAPETVPFCKVSPVSVRIAEHVSPGLFVAVQGIVDAGCARIRWREELVNRVAVGRLGAR